MKLHAAVTHADDYDASPYIAALEAAGIEPLLISPAHPDELPPGGGLLLCGGAGANPALYGEELHPEADPPEDALDTLELALLHRALEHGAPVFAICRGMQLLNISQGGSLQQHIAEWPAHRCYDTPKPQPVHSVHIVPGSKLAAIVGATNAAVNSRHHQAIARLGTGLVISARADDGLIEGVEIPSRDFVIGVQWHPENQAATDPLQARLFRAFASAIRNTLQ